MTKIKKLMTVVVCAVALTIGGCSGGGCKSATKQTLITSTATHSAASMALQGWNQHIKQVQLEVDRLAATDPDKAAALAVNTTNQINQVKVAWEKYQASQIAVLNASQALSKLPSGDTNAPPAQDRLTTAITASSVVLEEVLALLDKFGVK